jgi:penicillin-binding protein 2
MIVQFFKKNNLKRRNMYIEADEVFLDSKNPANFDRQQFEGRIEKPISKKTILGLGIFFFIIFFVFGAQLIKLQINNGDVYRKRSENNTLEKVNIFTERGIIYDRNKKELAWNKKDSEDFTPPTRTYLSPGFSHLLGYVSYPAKDNTGNWWQTEFVGKDGIEKEYNEILKGENGSKIIETNALGEIYSENTINAPKRGGDVILSIDSRIQKELFTLIKNLSNSNGFSGGAGIIMDVVSGEILTSTSFPEYNSEILSLGKDKKEIASYINDKRKVFLDRNISGLYTPGSIVKPYFAIGALIEGIINPTKKILSTGSISIPNPYFKDQKTIFKDWRVNGWTDMSEAIAVSSDIYFYTIGGGYGDQKGIGIQNIEKYVKLFGIGEKTGIDLPDEKSGTIPSPEWKAVNFKGDPWRIGDTYHTSIGQYGFQVTPISMVRASAAIANYGKMLIPHVLLEKKKNENSSTSQVDELKNINAPKEFFDVIHEGMREAVTFGTAVTLNVPYVGVAAKTGTAQVGISKNKVNSWVMGFFPYEKPKYSFIIMMEAGPSTNGVGAPAIMRQLLDWMNIYTPEYFK